MDTFKTYLTINNKYTILNSTFYFTINNTSTIYEIMAFNKNTSYTSTNKIFTLPYTCNFNRLQNIDISWEN